MTTIIERTPATTGTFVRTVLLYLVFTAVWVYAFANAHLELPSPAIVGLYLLPFVVAFGAGFVLARQEAYALLAFAPVLALFGPGVETALFVPLAMLAVFPGAPLVLLGIFLRNRMDPQEVEDDWF